MENSVAPVFWVRFNHQMSLQQQPDLSFVIPCHNEEDNLHPLVEAIRAAGAAVNRSWELILTDDRE